MNVRPTGGRGEGIGNWAAPSEDMGLFDGEAPEAVSGEDAAGVGKEGRARGKAVGGKEAVEGTEEGIAPGRAARGEEAGGGGNREAPGKADEGKEAVLGEAEGGREVALGEAGGNGGEGVSLKEAAEGGEGRVCGNTVGVLGGGEGAGEVVWLKEEGETR